MAYSTLPPYHSMNEHMDTPAHTCMNKRLFQQHLCSYKSKCAQKLGMYRYVGWLSQVQVVLAKMHPSAQPINHFTCVNCSSLISLAA